MWLTMIKEDVEKRFDAYIELERKRAEAASDEIEKRHHEETTNLLITLKTEVIQDIC